MIMRKIVMGLPSPYITTHGHWTAVFTGWIFYSVPVGERSRHTQISFRWKNDKRLFFFVLLRLRLRSLKTARPIKTVDRYRAGILCSHRRAHTRTSISVIIEIGNKGFCEILIATCSKQAAICSSEPLQLHYLSLCSWWVSRIGRHLGTKTMHIEW